MNKNWRSCKLQEIIKWEISSELKKTQKFCQRPCRGKITVFKKIFNFQLAMLLRCCCFLFVVQKSQKYFFSILNWTRKQACLWIKSSQYQDVRFCKGFSSSSTTFTYFNDHSTFWKFCRFLLFKSFRFLRIYERKKFRLSNIV